MVVNFTFINVVFIGQAKRGSIIPSFASVRKAFYLINKTGSVHWRCCRLVDVKASLKEVEKRWEWSPGGFAFSDLRGNHRRHDFFPSVTFSMKAAASILLWLT